MLVLMDPSANSSNNVLRVKRTREKRYAFDRAFDVTATARDVYEGSCKFLIAGVLNGYNATVFAYGPTGAGKTFTMVGTDEHPGVMVSAISDLFSLMADKPSDIQYKVRVSYVEIYNEQLRDLLVVDSPDLDLRDDSSGNATVVGVHRPEIESAAELFKLLKGGNKRRTAEATSANKASSRSHAVFELHIQQKYFDKVPLHTL